MEKCVSEISRYLPCREEQLEELYSLIGEANEPFPYSIYVHGNTSTGKTACLTSLLTYLDYKHAIINCVECYSPQIVFENILNSLFGHEMCSENAYASVYKCDNLKDFVDHLNSMFEDGTYEPVVIVFDNAEKLCKIDSYLFAALLKLKEYCNFNIATVFISCVDYEDLDLKVESREPIYIRFPQYTKKELYGIIYKQRKVCTNNIFCKYNIDDCLIEAMRKPEFFGNYLNALLSVFSRVCVDLCELRHTARINYLKYCEPVLNGSVKPDDVSKLWKNIAPILKESLSNLYLRVDSANTTSKSNAVVNELTSTKAFAQSFELPYYGKYLLVSAYLASYNPEKEDRRLFMKNHGKQKKRMQQVNAKAKISDKLNTQLGPKSFSLDRLLAIFYAILEEKIGLTCNLFSQIQTFVELGLLSASNDGETDRKYKCNMGYDFVTAIAETIGFNIRKYLYDFY